MILVLLIFSIIMFIVGAKIGSELTLTYLYNIGEITNKISRELETWKGFKKIINEN